MTSRPPTWEDKFIPWVDEPLTVGEPPHGFYYHDPLGFWREVRRWATVVMAKVERDVDPPDAVSVSALLHVADEPARLRRALGLMQPRVVLFLDETAWASSGLSVERSRAHHVPDPHRAGQVYEGFWGVGPDGVAVGKAPQHPAAHRLYRAEDVDFFLRSAPIRAR